MTISTDEFREWMEYLAGRQYVATVASRLASILLDELCPPEKLLETLPGGYPAVVMALVAAAALDRKLEIDWRGAGTPEQREDWDTRARNEKPRATLHAYRLVKNLPALGETLGDRRSALASTACLLFGQLWAKRGDRLLLRRQRCDLCQDHRTTSLRKPLLTWLRDLGTHTQTIGRNGGRVPLIAGNRVRTIVRVLRLSDRAAIAGEIVRRFAWPPENARLVAQLLVERPHRAGNQPLVRQLVMATKTPARDPGAIPRLDKWPDEEGLKAIARLLRNSARPGPGPGRVFLSGDLAALRKTDAHARDIIALAVLPSGEADPDLPGSVKCIQEILLRYCGLELIEVLDADLRHASPDGDGDISPLDTAPAGDGLPAEPPHVDPILELIDTHEARRTLQQLLEQRLPDREARLHAALLFGFTSLLPADASPAMWRRAELGPPTDPESWAELAALLGMTLPMLRQRRRRLKALILAEE